MLTTEVTVSPCDVCDKWKDVNTMRYIRHEDLSLCSACNSDRIKNPYEFAQQLAVRRQSPTRV